MTKQTKLGFPTLTRIAMNEVFSRYGVDDEWAKKFPELDYDDEELDILRNAGLVNEDGVYSPIKAEEEYDEEEDEDD